MYSKRIPQAPPIRRGGACNHCKRRKMRCDGMRPICGPCSKVASLEDCEYGEGGRTYADQLQEQITGLETRVEELQNTKVAPNVLALHDPYYASRNSHMSRSASRASGSNQTMNSSEGRTQFAQEKALMEAFQPHALQLGFFLDAGNIIYAFSSPNSDPRQRPTSALSAAMALLGAYLSPSPNILHLKEMYLSKAVQAASLGLSESHPQKILHTLQANVLISHYFFLHGRNLEGRWHLDNAVSLILSARMHRIRSSQIQDPQFISPSSTTTLPPARNVAEEGDRMNAMWTVLALNCLWSAAEGVPASIAYTTEQGRVDTPWPLDPNSYTDATFPPDLKNSHTLQKFLADIPDGVHSLLALYVKAAVLFEQTTVFSKRYSNPASRTPFEMRGFHSTFQNLRSIITRILTEVPPIKSGASAGTKKRLFVIDALLRATMIRLYCTFGAHDPSCCPMILDMANGMMKCLAMVDMESTAFWDPIMAIIWGGPASVFIQSIQISNNAGETQNSIRSLNQIMGMMARYSADNALMLSETQLAEIQAKYAAVTRR
ncbi:hypothetical protein BT96DRAFT_971617 [Gymnopus androsaceus JB14]|uniref:Zn(2)-C6 fungal-type domain-containing protein n=1 Tax=Gymnopus androsaceus JB14 TaxID=1447944 RepID=A0A6A4I8G9_9AGAR|nr:hypothetical protein BT96DRAFT_971617 [Gymnopus androsaceus JB14]